MRDVETSSDPENTSLQRPTARKAIEQKNDSCGGTRGGVSTQEQKPPSQPGDTTMFKGALERVRKSI